MRGLADWRHSAIEMQKNVQLSELNVRQYHLTKRTITNCIYKYFPTYDYILTYSVLMFLFHFFLSVHSCKRWQVRCFSYWSIPSRDGSYFLLKSNFFCHADNFNVSGFLPSLFGPSQSNTTEALAFNTATSIYTLYVSQPKSCHERLGLKSWRLCHILWRCIICSMELSAMMVKARLVWSSRSTPTNIVMRKPRQSIPTMRIRSPSKWHIMTDGVWWEYVSLCIQSILHLCGQFPLPFGSTILEPDFNLCLCKAQWLRKLHSSADT